MFLFCMIFLSSLVMAQEYRMEISTIPEDKIFESGKTFELKVTIYDSNNNLINDEVSIILKDVKDTIIKETTIQSSNFEEIELIGGIISGEGKIIVKYKDSEKTEPFFIKENVLAKFEINNEVLKITNIGNTKYEKKVYITIGSTTGTKNPSLKIGESTEYRLVAPEGVYSIRISDGETILTQNEVKLTGTGKVIGVLDETPSQRSPVTGGIRPENSEDTMIGYFKNSKFVYVFVFVVLGAMILLTIERRYRKTK